MDVLIKRSSTIYGSVVHDTLMQIYNTWYKFRDEKRNKAEQTRCISKVCTKTKRKGYLVLGPAAEIKNGRAPSGMIEELDLVDFMTTRDET